MTHVPPHLLATHEQYPEGFPERESDDLLGHWETPNGTVVVEHHPHGYEIHFYPCFDFENCDACAPDRGPSNPHTPYDGHHFRECESRGPVLTVAADHPETVLEYLSVEGSARHVRENAELIRRRADDEAELRRLEREENERLLAEMDAQEPPLEERFAALQAEFEDFRRRYDGDSR